MSLPRVGKCAAEWLCGLFGKVQCFLSGGAMFLGGRKGKGGYSVIEKDTQKLSALYQEGYDIAKDMIYKL